ncbi:endonuclease/exonuclease/phosphatase family protein [Sorangium sp. So ce1151]|uniref:endonuclease/exonuclease/phosphatase family protein n=1 Tax=Sorangium sp. So ce1151 TaxID=3133332 RepID=UPI003F5E38B8
MTRRRQTVLSWNIGIFFKKALSDRVRRSRLDILTMLLAEHAPSIVALQEAPADLGGREGLGHEYEIIRGPNGVATALRKAAWTPGAHRAGEGWRALVVKADPHGGGPGLWIWNLHLYPPGHRDSETRRALTRAEPRDDLRLFRERDPHRAEIVVGDFNLPPYDDAVMGYDGFHASRVREWVQSQEVHEGARYRPLFNATWPLLGLLTPPYGDFHRAKRKGDVGPWYVLSQALMSARLAIPGERQVRLLDCAGERPLCDKKHGRPDKDIGSDHLPLLITFLSP